MTGWLVLGAGLLTAAIGGTVAVSAASVSRLELSRWVSRRLRGAAIASTVYSAPARILRSGNAVAALGVLLSGAGVGALLSAVSPVVAWPLVPLVAVPIAMVAGYAIPRVVGRRWSESVVRRAAPFARHNLPMLEPLLATTRNGKPVLTGAVRARGDGIEYAGNEVEMISGVLSFTERMVRDVMTPRTEVVALEEGASLDDVARMFTESGYSRLPVYSGTLDNIVGMIHAFDLLKVTPGSELPIREVIQTPGTKDCSAMLLQFQRERRQMAVVLDEFGGTAGIVTLEDLLEELVGSIFDDDQRVPVDPMEAPLMEIDGGSAVDDVRARFAVELPAGAETVGGLLTQLAGRIPHPGERLRFAGLEFDVIRATPVRVERVLVRREPVESLNLEDEVVR